MDALTIVLIVLGVLTAIGLFAVFLGKFGITDCLIYGLKAALCLTEKDKEKRKECLKQTAQQFIKHEEEELNKKKNDGK